MALVVDGDPVPCDRGAEAFLNHGYAEDVLEDHVVKMGLCVGRVTAEQLVTS